MRLHYQTALSLSIRSCSTARMNRAVVAGIEFVAGLEFFVDLKITIEPEWSELDGDLPIVFPPRYVNRSWAFRSASSEIRRSCW